MRLVVYASLAAVVSLLICVPTYSAQKSNVFVDDQHRFSIQVAPGWVANRFSSGGVSGVTIAHGNDAYVQVFIQKGIDPASFLKALNNGIQANHPGYRITNRGTRSVAGEPRLFIEGDSPENPKSPHTSVYLETFAANGYSYAIIASSSGKNVPGKDKPPDYEVSQGMIQSFSLNGAPAPGSTAAAPVPANPPASDVVDATVAEKPPSDLPPDDQKKLAALDAALKGGALSEEEYETKKSALYSSSRAQQDRVNLSKALDQAYSDGVLTKDEYERKKRDLDGGLSSSQASEAPAPSTPSADAASAPASQPTADSSMSRNPNPDSEEAPLKSTEVYVAKAEPQPDPLPLSWVTHSDPAGFAVNLPGAWTVGKVGTTGQIVLRGARGEEIMIWPLRAKQPELDAHGAAALVSELARKFDVLMPWGTAQTTRNVARVIGLGAQRSGTAVLSWANSPNGASVYFYGIEAPGEVYSDATDSFVTILKSFHVTPDPPAMGSLASATGPGGGSISFTTWMDPHEGAFNVSVPQGWHVVGGAYRLNPMDVRYSAVMSSPDGQLLASAGDSNVGSFTQPTQVLAASGLREGGYQVLADGTRVEVLRYLTGQQFARSYVETLVSRQCSNPQITSNDSRDDVAAMLGESAASEGFMNALLTAGDVSFTCSLDGRPVKGKYITATIRMAPSASTMWFVYRIFGYIALAGREQDGELVLAQMLQSWKLTPEWRALQKDSLSGTVLLDTERSQQMRERAIQSITEDQRQTAEMIKKSSELREKSYDEIDHKRESSILGRLEIVDPETRTQYKINSFGDYHYLSNEGYVYNANLPGAPSSTLRELIALP